MGTPRLAGRVPDDRGCVIYTTQLTKGLKTNGTDEEKRAACAFLTRPHVELRCCYRSSRDGRPRRDRRSRSEDTASNSD